jgi:hypothetical protein
MKYENATKRATDAAFRILGSNPHTHTIEEIETAMVASLEQGGFYDAVDTLEQLEGYLKPYKQGSTPLEPTEQSIVETVDSSLAKIRA